MEKRDDLFGKTFDQQVRLCEGDIEGQNISPNRLLPAEIVCYPTGTGGVSITARNTKHDLLWGYIASRETVDRTHQLVAICGALRDLVYEEVAKYAALPERETDPLEEAKSALTALQATTTEFWDSLVVKKATKETLSRAAAIARAVADADNMIRLAMEAHRREVIERNRAERPLRKKQVKPKTGATK